MKNNRSKMSFYGFLKNSGLVLFFAAAFVLVNSANAKAGAPFNDNFENAEILSGTRVSVRRTNLAATKQQFEQVHAGNVGGRSVWFKWTAPMTGYFSFSTNLTETNIDTLLHVYTGSQLNDLSNVGFNNNINSPANLKSYRILPVRSGTTYYIAIDGFNNGSGASQGTFDLSIHRAFQYQGSDFDSDGKTDLALFRPSNGQWLYEKSSDNAIQSTLWGKQGDIPVSSSRSDRGEIELNVYRPSEGIWYQRPNFGVDTYLPWGASQDIPVSAQFGGENITEFGVFRPSTGEWFMYINGIDSFYYKFGSAGDIPVPGQYSADGFADIAVFRPSNSTWYFLKRQNSFVGLDQFSAVKFGGNGDLPVQGDYDGDGILDIAVYRPSNGNWWILQSSDQSVKAFHWGTGVDTPTTGDFDGDGLFDFAVFRNSTATWFIYNSSNGSTTIKQLGQQNDIPITSNYYAQVLATN